MSCISTGWFGLSVHICQDFSRGPLGTQVGAAGGRFGRAWVRLDSFHSQPVVPVPQQFEAVEQVRVADCHKGKHDLHRGSDERIGEPAHW